MRSNGEEDLFSYFPCIVLVLGGYYFMNVYLALFNIYRRINVYASSFNELWAEIVHSMFIFKITYSEH